MATVNTRLGAYQHEDEFFEFLEIIENAQPTRILEIGSLFGSTLAYWLSTVGEGGVVMTIDRLVSPQDDRYFTQLEQRNLWPQWAERNKATLHMHEGDSRAQESVQLATEAFPEGIDFLFIDGDHSYDGVKSDFEKYKHLVRSGGIIAFHDVVGLAEVARFWKELKQEHKATELIYHEGGWGIGVLYV